MLPAWRVPSRARRTGVTTPAVENVASVLCERATAIRTGCGSWSGSLPVRSESDALSQPTSIVRTAARTAASFGPGWLDPVDDGAAGRRFDELMAVSPRARRAARVDSVGRRQRPCTVH